MAGLKVQRADLIPLVGACVTQGQEILEGALLLADAGRLIGATNEFILGAQEIGKAKLLRDAYDAGDALPEIAGFYDHDAKVEAARTVLGSSALWLKGGAFQYGAFQSNAFDVAVPANESTRREVLYVDYASTGVRRPPPIDQSELRGHIVDALTIMPSVVAKLTEVKEATP